MESAIHHLFVYSSLRSGFHHPAYSYISKYFFLVSECTAKGKLFEQDALVVGVPTEDDFFVKGELYHIKEPAELSWALAQLDDYEGVQIDEDGNAPNYQRALTTVYHDGKSNKAWVYWFNQPIISGKFIESGDILAYLQQKK
ncbi:MAG: gamma-glutamylcyclotransferase family protein [Sphingobacteriia bacterium]|jgi:gamma-glutamylcyclotransferase (GGCT)/AIG2-like uncharacterized protein YtfP